MVEAAQPQGGSYDAGYLGNDIYNPRMVYVKYAAGEPAAFPEIAEAFLKLAAARGHRTETVEIIQDRRGRPIYEILALRLLPAEGSRRDPRR